MSEQDKALDKIRRLLRLGTSANEHEARLALAKAAEIAERCSIDLGCVKAEEERSRVIEQSFESSRLSFDEVERTARQLCMWMFHVQCLFTLKEVTFVGFEHNVTAARFAYSFIIEQCARDLDAYRKARGRARRKLGKGATESYCLGWSVGVLNAHEAAQKVAPPPELENSKRALVLRSQEEEVQDYCKDKYPAAEEEKRRKQKKDLDARRAGHEAGQKVRIGMPLADTEELQLQLT